MKLIIITSISLLLSGCSWPAEEDIPFCNEYAPYHFESSPDSPSELKLHIKAFKEKGWVNITVDNHRKYMEVEATCLLGY